MEGILMRLLTKCRSASALALCVSLLGTTLAVGQTRVQPPRPINPTPLCPVQTGAGTVHGSNINAGSVESWGPANGPHVVSSDISIYGVLTIEQCTVVRIASARSITVYAGGTMLVSGTRIYRASISNQVGGTAWRSIRNLGGTLSLSHVSISGGGATQNPNLASSGTLEINSTNTKSATRRVRACSLPAR
jgi:hypothetical protein